MKFTRAGVRGIEYEQFICKRVGESGTLLDHITSEGIKGGIDIRSGSNLFIKRVKQR